MVKLYHQIRYREITQNICAEELFPFEGSVSKKRFNQVQSFPLLWKQHFFILFLSFKFGALLPFSSFTLYINRHEASEVQSEDKAD